MYAPKKCGEKQVQIILLNVLLAFAFISQAIAQDQPFSNKVEIDSYGNEIMPYARGEVVRMFQPSSENVPKAIGQSHLQTFGRMADVVAVWGKLNPPQGFRASFRSYNSKFYNSGLFEFESQDPNPYYEGIFSVVFEPYFKSETGKPIVSPQGVGANVTVYFNNPYRMAGSPLIEDIYLCPRQTSDFYGFPIYQTNLSELTIVSKKQLPLFLPVSQEEFLMAHIRFWEKELEKNKKEQQLPENQLSIKGTFDAEKAERIKTMEEAYRTILQYDQNAAEEFRREFLKTESEVGADLSTDPDAGVAKSDLIQTSVDLAKQTVELLQAELDALTPQQRKLQAHFHVDAQEKYHNRSGMVPYERAKPHENCEPLVRINPQLVDARNPNPQLMIISWDILFNAADSHESPRFFNDDPKASQAHTGDRGIAELYKQEAIWKRMFDLINQ